MQRSTVVLVSIAALGMAAGVGAASRSDRDDGGAKLAKALAGLTPGKPVSCIPISYPTITTQAYGRTLLYRVNQREVYRNDTAGGCEGAGGDDILVSVEHEGRPCSGDIIRTVDRNSRIPTGSCSLGDFVPYRKAG